MKTKGAKSHALSHAGQMTIRPEGEGADLRVIFEDQATGSARVVSGTIVHAVAIAVLLAVGYFLPEKVYETILPERLSKDIVWLDQPGPGGGGGGGNKSPEPPKKAEIPKTEIPKVPEPVPTPVEAPVIEPEVLVPIQTIAAAPTITPGAISASSTSTDSRGSGTGTGAGPGTGSGIGPGSGGGIGGGVYGPGNGVILPVVLFEKKPQYTAEAMRAKVQGTVWLECIVMADGTVGSVEVIRSLDQTFGLDQEAVKAAKQWRFKPGTRFGEPVNVRVTIELTFTLR
jgi:protein TonB